MSAHTCSQAHAQTRTGTRTASHRGDSGPGRSPAPREAGLGETGPRRAPGTPPPAAGQVGSAKGGRHAFSVKQDGSPWKVPHCSGREVVGCRDGGPPTFCRVVGKRWSGLPEGQLSPRGVRDWTSHTQLSATEPPTLRHPALSTRPPPSQAHTGLSKDRRATAAPGGLHPRHSVCLPSLLRS